MSARRSTYIGLQLSELLSPVRLDEKVLLLRNAARHAPSPRDHLHRDASTVKVPADIVVRVRRRGNIARRRFLRCERLWIRGANLRAMLVGCYRTTGSSHVSVRERAPRGSVIA